jgi:hypothetical protein
VRFTPLHPPAKTPLLPKAEAAQARGQELSVHVNNAIRMMIGIGMPRKNSSNERMMILLS